MAIVPSEVYLSCDVEMHFLHVAVFLCRQLAGPFSRQSFCIGGFGPIHTMYALCHVSVMELIWSKSRHLRLVCWCVC